MPTKQKVSVSGAARRRRWWQLKQQWSMLGVFEIDQEHEFHSLTCAMKTGLQAALLNPPDTPPLDQLTTDLFKAEETQVHEGFEMQTFSGPVFCALRRSVDLSEEEYCDSLASDACYLQFISNSKSKADFFVTHDKRFFLKTQSRREVKFLLSNLPLYVDHLNRYPHSLLVRFLGRYCHAPTPSWVDTPPPILGTYPHTPPPHPGYVPPYPTPSWVRTPMPHSLLGTYPHAPLPPGYVPPYPTPSWVRTPIPHSLLGTYPHTPLPPGYVPPYPTPSWVRTPMPHSLLGTYPHTPLPPGFHPHNPTPSWVPPPHPTPTPLPPGFHPHNPTPSWKYFIIMQSVFYPDERINIRYDIKGCELGRWTHPIAQGNHAIKVLKDNNFEGQQITLGGERSWFEEQVELDSVFLRRLNVLDYSLLLGQQPLHRDELDQKHSLANLVTRTTKSMDLDDGPIERDLHTRPLLEKQPEVDEELAEDSDQASPGEGIPLQSLRSGGAETEFHAQHRRLLPDFKNPVHVLDGQEIRYFVGIIDIFTVYNWKKKLEHFYKVIRFPGRAFSTVSPADYSLRFCQWVRRRTQ
ncbi:hypothetical protein NHX12_028257 [Muraenolepis orangiensis]|uniref:PIPK domain-containing protein n=1 Tax=Muraenolepis orangiensis TaxID=630683 RepID=A0A9Q0EFJ5_9TELE|nr:hypothetical protein NHX12_028257 [Muraenolepis orangiensis]